MGMQNKNNVKITILIIYIVHITSLSVHVDRRWLLAIQERRSPLWN